MAYNLSDFNKHWDTRKLNELGEFSRGKSKHRPRNDPKLFKNGIYPLIQTGDVRSSEIFVTSHSQKYNEFGLKQSKLWEKGTLCITIAANIAETAIIAYPMCFPDSVVGFNAFKKETSEFFMHYVFTYIRTSIQNSVSGSIQDNINIEYLTSLDFKIPKKEYQDNIVDVLFSLDKKIALNNRIISELEAMAKTIYDYWFVQFDFPNENGKPYRQSGGEMEYNGTLKREIPKGWKAEIIGNLLDKVPNASKTLTTSYLAFGKIPVIDQSTDYIAGYVNDETAKISIEGGGIVFGDHTRIVKHVGFDFARGADGTQVLISKNKEVMPQLLLLQIVKSIDLSNYGYARHFKFLKEHLCVVPSREISQLFNKIANPIYKDVTCKILENLELTRLRDWLLPMLMNGQATVGEE